MRRLILATSVVVLCAPSVAAAERRTATAELGGVRAELEWDSESPSTFAPALRITREGNAFDYAPSECASTPDDENLYCGQPGVDEGREPLVVRDLDGDGEPEVLVELYSGGAHCCFILVLYRWDAGAGAYVTLKNNFADIAHELRDVDGDGKVELISGDARFAYLWASFAESRFPIIVYAFTDGELVDVTRRYPALLRADARQQLQAYRELRKEGLNGRGALAAYLADRYRLGERKQGWRRVRRALRPGGLSRAERRFQRSLRRYLRRWGYAGSAD